MNPPKFNILCGLSGTIVSLALLATSARAGLLIDPSFELATNDTQTSNSPWSLSPAGAVFSTSVWAASDGATGVWFQSFNGSAGAGVSPTLSQTVTSVADSGTYLLTFDSARETNFAAGSFTAILGSSGGATVSVDLLNAPYNDTGNMESNPTKFSLELPGVQAGEDLTVSISMVDGINAGIDPQSAMVDNFNLDLIPEPTSLALVGMSLLCFLGFRRRR